MTSFYVLSEENHCSIPSLALVLFLFHSFFSTCIIRGEPHLYFIQNHNHCSIFSYKMLHLLLAIVATVLWTRRLEVEGCGRGQGRGREQTEADERRKRAMTRTRNLWYTKGKNPNNILVLLQRRKFDFRAFVNSIDFDTVHQRNFCLSV